MVELVRKITTIGVNPGHNATAALLSDGRLIALESYERETRIKNSLGWPTRLVERYIAQMGGYEAIDAIAVGTNSAYHMTSLAELRGVPTFMVGDLGDRKPCTREEGRANDQSYLAATRGYNTDANLAALPALFEEKLNVRADKLRFYDHQMSHAYSTLPFIPQELRGQRWLVLTLDGMGDGKAGSVSMYVGGAMILLDDIPDTHSLGLIYAYVTMLLGFRAYEHEYKIMGLAPYAKGDHWRPLVKRFEEVLSCDPITGVWSGMSLGMSEREAVLAEIIGFCRFDNVAAALQAYVEQQVENWVSAWIGRTGIKNIACAGGFFMNVKANQRVAALPGLDRFVVVPSSGDESVSIGAAVLASLAEEPDLYLEPVKGLYLGRGYSREEVEEAVRSTGADQRYTVTEPADMAEAAAEILAAGGVVARCDGPMEFGARALGNRSIMADPSRLDTVAFINQAIKSRDFWMPFAPSILEERATDYFDLGTRVTPDYMMVSFNSTEKARKELVAAIHQADKSLRPQIVRADWNPGYHKLISAFERQTGIGAVLNTSFNIHGEPIVGSPADAISTMDRSGLVHLIVGHLLLQKRAAA